MSKLRIDEDFLQWWKKGLEEEGHDLYKKQIRVLAHPEKKLYHVYSYHELFNAMRRGEHGPLLAYQVAYQICNQSRLEALAQEEAEIIPFPRKPRE